MAGGLVEARKRLLHLNVFIDEREPRLGILELLGRLRPQWKAQDIQMKASQSRNVYTVYCFHD